MEELLHTRAGVSLSDSYQSVVHHPLIIRPKIWWEFSFLKIKLVKNIRNMMGKKPLIVQLSREENPGGGQLSAGQTEGREAEGMALGHLRDVVSEPGAAAALRPPLALLPTPDRGRGHGSRGAVVRAPAVVTPAF